MLRISPIDEPSSATKEVSRGCGICLKFCYLSHVSFQVLQHSDIPVYNGGLYEAFV